MKRGRIEVALPNGTVLIGSDMHRWPGKATTAERAFTKMAKALQPAEIVLNGDVIDGAKISRHPPIGWEDAPEIGQEIKAAKKPLEGFKQASPKSKRRWTLGNHDARFETMLAKELPQYKHIPGMHLKDHFPDWDPCWSVVYNGDTVVTHRFKGGMHAARNNVLHSGQNYVTGHTHRLTSLAFSFDNVTRFGVESGMLARLDGPQFTGYTESNPLDWRPGFVVLTFKNGQLLWPEVCHVVDEDKGLVAWRGEVVKV